MRADPYRRLWILTLGNWMEALYELEAKLLKEGYTREFIGFGDFIGNYVGLRS